ncbi:MAG: hypothetical protein J2P18_22660, partial [Nocardia sp.]|nr:hypothetical protein [Nocardia sp.]
MSMRRSAGHKQWGRRCGALLVIGALPVGVALAQAAPAAADPAHAVGPAARGPHIAPIPDHGAPAAPMPDVLARVVASLSTPAIAVPGTTPRATHSTTKNLALRTAPGPTTVTDRNAAAGTRVLPDLSRPAAVDPGALHMPDATHSVPAVAPIQAPKNTIRIGSALVPRPDMINPEQAAQINDSAARTEAGMAQALDSVGFAPSRSDRIAADTMGSAATGAVVGAAVTSPIAATSALVGGVAGLVTGVVFAPAGLVVMPAVGAAIGAGVITAPSAAVGAALGAGAGAVEGVLA